MRAALAFVVLLVSSAAATASISLADDVTFPSVIDRLYKMPKTAAPTFAISNTLGSNMVLQRAPQAALVWGFAATGTTVKTSFQGSAYSSTADATGIWRQALPPQPATSTPASLTFTSSTGEPSITITNILFGDVFICSGQS
jgi:hypothetical protein